MALSLTGDSSFRAPMGVTVIGGLIFSTVLTLLIVPASFSMAVDVESWFGRKFGKFLDNGEPHGPNRGATSCRVTTARRTAKVSAMTRAARPRCASTPPSRARRG